RSRQRRLGGPSRIQLEHRAVGRSLKLGLEPLEQLELTRQARHAFVLDGGKDRAADDDLAARVPRPRGLVRAGYQSVFLDSQTREPFVNYMQAGSDVFRVRHRNLQFTRWRLRDMPGHKPSIRVLRSRA